MPRRRVPLLRQWASAVVAFGLMSAASGQEEVGQDQQSFLRSYVASYDPHNPDSAALYAACRQNPDAAQQFFRSRLDDPRAPVRELAVEVLTTLDRQGNLPYIVRALEEPIWIAERAVQHVDWTRADPELRVVARGHLRHWVENGSVNCALSLGVVGTKEDLPALRGLLAKVIAGEIEQGDSERRGQAEWEVTHQGIPPLERAQLNVRQAMAKLGDEEELASFRARLFGSDRERARDALYRVQYIAREELVGGVVHCLDIADPPGTGALDVWPRTTAGLAALALYAIYPDVSLEGASSPDFWRKWCREHLVPVPATGRSPSSSTEGVLRRRVAQGSEQGAVMRPGNGSMPGTGLNGPDRRAETPAYESRGSWVRLSIALLAMLLALGILAHQFRRTHKGLTERHP